MKRFLSKQNPGNAGSIIIIGIIILLSYGVPIFLGESWIPFSQLKHNCTSYNMPKSSPSYDDFSTAYFEIPYRKVSKDTWSAIKMPLWNPYTALGTPLIGQYQTQIFFPIEILETFASPLMQNILILLKIFVAGLGCYLFGISLLQDKVAALFLAVFYIFSGYFVGFKVVSSFISGAIMVPWVFYAIISLMKVNSNYIFHIIKTSIIFSMLFLCGQPQIAILTMLFATIVLFCNLIFISREKYFTVSMLFLISVAMAVLIASPQILAFREVLEHGYNLHPPGSYSSLRIPVYNFFTILWPQILGEFLGYLYPYSQFVEQHEFLGWWNTIFTPSQFNPEAFPFYLCASGFILSLLSMILVVSKLLNRQASYKEKFIGTMAILGVCTILSIIIGTLIASQTLHNILYRIPYLNQINIPRYISPVLSFSFATISAYLIASIQDLTTRHIKFFLFYFIPIVITLIVVFYNKALLSASHYNYTIMLKYTWMSLSYFVFTSIFLILLIILHSNNLIKKNIKAALFLIMLAEMTLIIRYGFKIDLEIYRGLQLVPLYFSVILLILDWKLISRLLAGIGLFIVPTFIFLTSDSHLFPLKNVYSDDTPATVKFLQAELGENSENGRILSTVGILSHGVPAGFKISEITSINPQQIDTTAYYIFNHLVSHEINYVTPVAFYGMEDDNNHISWSDYFNNRAFYNAISIKYLIDYSDGWISKNKPENLSLVFVDSNKNISIYKDKLALSRAYTTTLIHKKLSIDDARLHMHKKEFNPLNTVIVEDPDNMLADFENDGAEMIRRNLIINRLEANEVNIKVDAMRNEFLVLNDGFYPGWHVSVDGIDSKIYRVNAAVRGVYIPAGTKEVIFYYKPKYFYYALFVSAFILVIYSMYYIKKYLLTFKKYVALPQL